MAEVIRIERRGVRRPTPLARLTSVPAVPPAREVHYDYAEGDAAEKEAERLWNDSEPTVPGTITVPPEATPPPAGDVTSIEINTSVDVISMKPVRRSGARLRWLALAAVATTGAIGVGQWAFAQRKVSRPAATPALVVAAPPTVVAIAAPSSPPEIVPVPSPPAAAAVEASPRPTHAISSERHHRRGDERRSHRREGAIGGAGAVAPETVEVELGARPKRGRLRPIDTTDPFAP